MNRVMFDQHNVSLGTCTGEVLDQLNYSLCSPCQDGGPHVSVNAATARERQLPGSQQSRWSGRFGSIVWIDWFSAWGRFQPSAGAYSASARALTARLPHPQSSHSPMTVDGPMRLYVEKFPTKIDITPTPGNPYTPSRRVKETCSFMVFSVK